MWRDGDGNEGIAGGCWRAAEKSEFGLCGVVGGMMAIELLAGTMRLDRISPEAVGRAAKRALCGVPNCRS